MDDSESQQNKNSTNAVEAEEVQIRNTNSSTSLNNCNQEAQAEEHNVLASIHDTPIAKMPSKMNTSNVQSTATIMTSITDSTQTLTPTGRATLASIKSNSPTASKKISIQSNKISKTKTQLEADHLATDSSEVSKKIDQYEENILKSAEAQTSQEVRKREKLKVFPDDSSIVLNTNLPTFSTDEDWKSIEEDLDDAANELPFTEHTITSTTKQLTDASLLTFDMDCIIMHANDDTSLSAIEVTKETILESINRATAEKANMALHDENQQATESSNEAATESATEKDSAVITKKSSLKSAKNIANSADSVSTKKLHITLPEETQIDLTEQQADAALEAATDNKKLASAVTATTNTLLTTTATPQNVVTIPVTIMQPEDSYTYVCVKASLYDSTCAVFGLNDVELQAIATRFENVVKPIVNGVIISVPPLVMINTLAQLYYKIVCSSGEAEICWTMEREV